MEDFNDINEVRKEDIVVGIARGTIGLIPGSSFFTEYWTTFLGSPLENRRNLFFQQMHERILILESNKDLNVESLKENDAFIDAILEIIPMYQKTSFQDKHDAFKNALSNIALNLNPDETQTHIFIRLIDSLSVAHIKLLQFLDDPSQWLLSQNQYIPYEAGSLMRLLNLGLPSIGNEALAELIITDLKNYGLLIKDTSVGSRMDQVQAAARKSTWLGRSFLAFIKCEL